MLRVAAQLAVVLVVQRHQDANHEQCRRVGYEWRVAREKMRDESTDAHRDAQEGENLHARGDGEEWVSDRGERAQVRALEAAWQMPQGCSLRAHAASGGVRFETKACGAIGACGRGSSRRGRGRRRSGARALPQKCDFHCCQSRRRRWSCWSRWRRWSRCYCFRSPPRACDQTPAPRGRPPRVPWPGRPSAHAARLQTPHRFRITRDQVKSK